MWATSTMPEHNQFAIVTLDTLVWPDSLKIPSQRFRLFVAADTNKTSVEALSQFAESALARGMVYFCAWGPGCQRFHDVVDEIRDEVFRQGRFTPPTPDDTVMTTWHDDEDLEEALFFFATCAYPTDEYAIDSEYWLAICVGNPEWAETAEDFLHSSLH